VSRFYHILRPQAASEGKLGNARLFDGRTKQKGGHAARLFSLQPTITSPVPEVEADPACTR
jgi:hypothetical protein